MLIASAAMSAVGAVAGGVAASNSANAQANAADYNAKIQENQATVARYNAQSAGEQAAAREEMQRRRFAQVQGQAIAGLAQSGTDLASGSNKDILDQNALAAELDALTIRYEGSQARDSYANTSSNLMSQAQLSRYNASAYRSNADAAMTGGFLNAGANLLSGASKYAYYKETGKLPGIG
jgi:hypothetical protein